MFKFLNKLFKQNKKNVTGNMKSEYDSFSIASMLAYEVARSDGNVSESELNYIKKLAFNNGIKDSEEFLNKISEFSKNNHSFYDFVKEINMNFTKEEKENLILILWDIAFSDGELEVHEDRLIRRIADLINIKDVRVLKLKYESKNQ